MSYAGSLCVVKVSLTGGGMMKIGNDDYKAAIVGFDEDKDVAVLKIAVDNTKVAGLQHLLLSCSLATVASCWSAVEPQ